jgi:hypothetical protein
MSNLPALYVIAQEFQKQAEQLADMDLDQQTLNDTLESIKWPVEEKARAVAAVIGNMGYANEMLADFIKRKQEQLKASKAREEHLREYLLHNMQVTGISEIKANDGSLTIAIRKNPPSVVVDDEATLRFAHPEFVKVVTTESLDKSGISAALKAGQIVEGARLASSDRVSIK